MIQCTCDEQFSTRGSHVPDFPCDDAKALQIDTNAAPSQTIFEKMFRIFRALPFHKTTMPDRNTSLGPSTSPAQQFKVSGRHASPGSSASFGKQAKVFDQRTSPAPTVKPSIAERPVATTNTQNPFDSHRHTLMKEASQGIKRMYALDQALASATSVKEKEERGAACKEHYEVMAEIMDQEIEKYKDDAGD